MLSPPRLSDFMRAKLADFRAHGYTVFNAAVEHDLIDSFWMETERLFTDNPALKFSLGEEILTNEERWARGDRADGPTIRAIDIERHSQTAPTLFLHRHIVGFLSAYYGARPTCIQTLTYEKSSEQGPHSDKYLVSPATVGMDYDRESLAAAWIACEDADEANGALIIYPGSHKLEKKRLGDDIADYGDYMRYLDRLCEENGCSRQTFHARKGDILFWHADFVHAGGPIKDPARTRKSLVAHYAKLSRFRRPHDRARRLARFGGGRFFK